MSEQQIHQFPNGITLIHKQVPHTKIAHCGFVLGVGSRDEAENQHGIAHFWEHMAFKGTKKRRAYHILNRLDSVGGELNAFTTKEKIVFHASVLDNHFEKALDLLTDITFHATFPTKEIAKERGVILEEMAYYQDNPSEAIYDEFDQILFGKEHPLGRLIIGTHESVNSFQQADFQGFIAGNLDTSRLVFSSVSALPFSKVFKLVEKYLSAIPAQHTSQVRTIPNGYHAQEFRLQKSSSQAHCIIGTKSYSLYHPKRIAFAMLNNLLGGVAMNSRLNLLLREKHGLVYSVDVSSALYHDTGSAMIGFATEKKTLNRSISLILRELKRLREQALGTLQLHAAKQQIMGQLAMGEESNLGYMLMMGQTWLNYGKIDSLQEVFDKVQQISAADLQEVAQEVYLESNLSYLIFEPAG